jgi:hypothetical protein
MNSLKIHLDTKHDLRFLVNSASEFVLTNNPGPVKKDIVTRVFITTLSFRIYLGCTVKLTDALYLEVKRMQSSPNQPLTSAGTLMP